MDAKEFGVIAKGLRETYRQFHFLETDEAIEIWYRMTSDIDYKLFSTVAYQWIATNKYPPSIADIRENVKDLMSRDKVSDWSEAWETVLRMIRRYGMYQPEKAYEEMDEMTRMVTKRLGFKELCMSENIAVDRANFRMIYEQLQERKRKSEQLPEFVKTRIEMINNEVKAIEDKI